MADIFIEQMVRRKVDSSVILKRVLLWLTIGLVVLIVLPVTLLFSALAFVTLPVGFLGVWGLYRQIKLLHVEYEYILTNSDLDIDCIQGRSKRKRQLSVDCRNFDILAPYKPDYAREYESQSIKNKLDFTSGDETAERFFALFSGKDGARTLLVFEPNERIRTGMKTYLRNKYKES